MFAILNNVPEFLRAIFIGTLKVRVRGIKLDSSCGLACTHISYFAYEIRAYTFAVHAMLY